MELLNGTKGSTYEILDLKVSDHIAHRLQAIGILEGTKVQILNKKKKGAIIIKVRGSRWAIGAGIARGMIVRGDKIDEKDD